MLCKDIIRAHSNLHTASNVGIQPRRTRVPGGFAYRLLDRGVRLVSNVDIRSSQTMQSENQFENQVSAPIWSNKTRNISTVSSLLNVVRQIFSHTTLNQCQRGSSSNK